MKPSLAAAPGPHRAWPAPAGPAASMLAAGLLVVLPPAMWLANRSSPLLLGLAAASLIAGAAMTGRWPVALSRVRAGCVVPVGLSLGAFLLWSLVSVGWSHRPAQALSTWGELALPLACGLVLATCAAPRVDRRLVRALAAALLLTAALIVIELALGLSQRVALGLGKGIERTDVFNRPVLTCVMLCPAVLPSLWARGGRGDKALALAAALSVIVATLISESGAAKFGVIVMAVVWLLACLAPRFTLCLVALGFAATMLLAPVVGRLTDAAIPAGLHQRLADSHSRARVDIWLSFGEAIAARPLIGSGFGASAALERHPVAASVAPSRREMLAVGHPHSAPIQAWTETGGIGAMLIALAGLASLARLRHLPAAVLGPRLALFASAFAVASVAHGAWQGWWWAALALATALLWLDRAALPDQKDGNESHG